MSVFHEIKTNSPSQLLWENKYFFCLLDGFPISPGHSLIIPNREAKSVLELNKDEWAELQNSIKYTIEKLVSINLKDKYQSMLKSANNPKSKEYIKKSNETY